MARPKKLKDPVTLFCAIESKMHGKLRRLAYKEKRSLADVVREALAVYLDGKKRGEQDIPPMGPSIFC